MTGYSKRRLPPLSIPSNGAPRRRSYPIEGPYCQHLSKRQPPKGKTSTLSLGLSFSRKNNAMSAPIDLREAIVSALSDFENQPLAEAGRRLFATLGYAS